MKRLGFLFAVLGLLAGPLQSQSWTSLGPYGGTVRSLVAPSQPGRVYATADVHGVFRSLDAGNSWTAVFRRLVTGNLAVDPVQPSTLYVVSQPGPLWKSVDSGSQWFRPNNGPVGPGNLLWIAVDPARHERLYAALDVGVARSTDGGVTWKLVTDGVRPTSQVVAVRSPAGTAFAATGVGLFRTTDGGNSWSRVAGGLPAAPVEELLAAPSDPQVLYALVSGRGLYRTKDGGASWKPVLQPPSPDGQVLSLAVDPRSADVLYAGVAGGLYRSRDGGRSWSALRGTMGSTTAVAADPKVPGRLYAGFAAVGGAFVDGIFRSDDGGSTWQRSNQGFSALEATGVSVALDDPDAVWTSTRPNLLFRSTNQGRRWARVPLIGVVFPVPRGLEAVSDLSVFVRAGAVFPSYGSEWRTDDAGAHWRMLLDTRNRQPLGAVRLAPSDPATLYALMNQGPFVPGYSVLRSTDRGETWEVRSQNLPLDFGTPTDLAVSPSDASVLYVTGAQGTAAKVLRSTDGGATFLDISAGLPPGVVNTAAVDPGDPDRVYIVLAGPFPSPGIGVWKTEDGGATWRRASAGLPPPPNGPVPTELLATSVPGRVYAAVRDRVFRTEDGGESWHDVTGNLQAPEVLDLSASLIEPERIYAATTNGVWLLEEQP